jgi:cytochrome d ubiquinol oxidase subunit I
MFETYFFLIEAVFLALYMSTWGKVNPWLHWVFGIFIILGSIGTAYAITSVNGWMNLPTGFDIVGGSIANPDVVAAMFSTPAIVTFLHSMPGYLLSSGLVMAGCYAVHLVRVRKSERTSERHKLDYFIISKLMFFVAIALLGSIITADMTGKYLAAYEPDKLAAIELHHTTSTNAPFVFGGVPDANGQPTGWYIEVPVLLSFLACNSFECEVQGLDATPKEYQPPLYIHVIFDIKLVLVGIVTAMTVAYFVVKKWFPSVLASRPLLLLLAAFSVAGVVIVELGWMLTEIGRQPWAVRGFVTTAEAVTKSHDVTSFGYLFPLTYAFLFGLTFIALRKLIKTERAKKGGVLV